MRGPHLEMCAVASLLTLLVGCGPRETRAAPSELTPLEAGRQVVTTKCSACHTLEGARGPLAPSLAESLASAEAAVAEFDTQIAELRAGHPEAYGKYAPAIEAVLAEHGGPPRLSAWLREYIRAPKFVDPNNTMAPVKLSDDELAHAVVYLTELPRRARRE